jgi:adenylate cyclase
MIAKQDSVLPGLEADKRRMLKSLIRIYSPPDSLFLNFYGPPGSIPTIPAHEILVSEPSSPVLSEFRGKAVFIGFSDTLNCEQRDGFCTVFSRPDGTDLSGVEIAATAFANLLENRPVHQLPPAFIFCIIFLYGLILSVCAMLFPALVSTFIVAAGTIAYFLVVRHQFVSQSLWIPLGIPALLQSPLAFGGCLFRDFHLVRRELQDVRKAFGFFLPAKVIDRIVKDMSQVKGVAHSSQTMFAAVLCSDGEQYARLAETMKPGDLNNFLNRFYESIFSVVEANHGTVSDIIGDSMLAVWATAQPDPAQRRNACRAAWSMMQAVRQFNEQNRPFTLGARIGLHYGEIQLGTVGGADHYEYRPIGDVVNTASRIENLNKHFQTKILVTGTMIDGLQDFLLRELGRFVLGGKTTPVTVFELVCPTEESDQTQQRLASMFSVGLREFEKQNWDKATVLFKEYLKVAGNDAAATFYLKRCESFRQDPPGASWDGLISTERI